MASLADLVVNIGADTSDLESGLGNAAGFIDDNIGKITAMGAIGGAALEGFARSQQETNVAFERMGRVTGEGSQAMRDMAGDLQNVTFPMEDVVSLMETASQRGLEGDAIAEYATFWDMVGDATGEAGPALGEAGVALGLVGIKAGEEAEALGAFGYITDNTTGSVEGFLKFIEKTAGELGDATPNVDDMAGALGALEDAGYSSQRAQRELRTALSETDGDMVAALETLGVSEESFRAQVDAVDASSGSIQANAQAYADSFTPMQKLQAEAEAMMTKYGGLADAAGMLAVPMLALGPVMKGAAGVFKLASGEKVAAMGRSVVATVKSTGTMIAAGAKWAAATAAQAAKSAAAFVASTGRMIAAGATWVAQQIAQGARAVASMAVTTGKFIAHYAKLAAQSLINAAKVAASWLIAMGPIAIVIAAVVGLVVVIVKNWDKIKSVIAAGWNWVKTKTSEFVAAVVGFVTGLRDRVVAGITELKDRALAAFQALSTGAIEKGKAFFKWYVGIPGRLLSAIGNLGSLLIGKGKDLIQGLWNGIKSMGSWLASKITGFVKDKIPGPIAKALGISSPSTVAADLAREVPRGMVVGMKAELGRLQQMAETTALAALPGLSTPDMPRVGAPLGLAGGSSHERELALLARIADAVEQGGTDWEQVGRTIGRETAREQQTRQRMGV